MDWDGALLWAVKEFWCVAMAIIGDSYKVCHTKKSDFFNLHLSFYDTPLRRRGGILFCWMKVYKSVSIPVHFRSITCERIDQLAWYFPCALAFASRWPLLKSGFTRSKVKVTVTISVKIVCRLITRQRLDWLAWYLTCALALDSRWPLLKLGSLGQRSRSLSQ